MFTLIFILTILVIAVAGEYKAKGYYYGGRYSGTCGHDGIYIHDEWSLILCSNGIAYYQPCAPGTKNSGHERFVKGKYYNSQSFCDVNLVDYGFYIGAGHGHHGRSHSYNGGHHRGHHGGLNGYKGGPHHQGYHGNHHGALHDRKQEHHHGHHGKDWYPEVRHHLRHHGRHRGKCGYDGIHVYDESSLILCSNGVAFYQPCPPGTKNSGQRIFAEGKHHNMQSFCDVNLVNYGFKTGAGHGHHDQSQSYNDAHQTGLNGYQERLQNQVDYSRQQDGTHHSGRYEYHLSKDQYPEVHYLHGHHAHHRGLQTALNGYQGRPQNQVDYSSHQDGVHHGRRYEHQRGKAQYQKVHHLPHHHGQHRRHEREQRRDHPKVVKAWSHGAKG